MEVHTGFICDHPDCRDKEKSRQIVGERWKCSVCSDFDFCANCYVNHGGEHTNEYGEEHVFALQSERKRELRKRSKKKKSGYAKPKYLTGFKLFLVKNSYEIQQASLSSSSTFYKTADKMWDKEPNKKSWTEALAKMSKYEVDLFFDEGDEFLNNNAFKKRIASAYERSFLDDLLEEEFI